MSRAAGRLAAATRSETVSSDESRVPNPELEIENPPDARAENGPLQTTRREFLAYSTTAVAVVALPLEANAAPRAATSRVRGPGPVELVLHLNGTRRRVEVEPGASLAEALRERLGHTGTKIGCDRGSCSACTVLLDGTPVSACMTLALDV
jgi:hypothetical protein